MADEKIIFSMSGVNKIYPPGKQVLKNIYLSFFYGAKIGVLGLNGSGKSSLLRIIAGTDKEFQGEVVSDLGYSVGMLEQEPQLDSSRTVREIVEQGVGLCFGPDTLAEARNRGYTLATTGASRRHRKPRA